MSALPSWDFKVPEAIIEEERGEASEETKLDTRR
jgi:hypothetical protein